MAERLKICFEHLPLERLGRAVSVITQALAAEQGVRLGQSAVLSTKVHAFHPQCPEHVQILINSDAGQVFYQRQDKGVVWHLDIFHECGGVDHRQAAKYLCQAIHVYNIRAANHQTELACRGIVNPAFMDIQTATGGGRITGTLLGGQKESVRRAHENHVHVALIIPKNEVPCLFYIVAAVEAAIVDAGLELRCNERISHVTSVDSQADLTSYSDQTDSLLIGKPPAGQAGQGTQNSNGAAVGQTLLPTPDSSGSPALSSHPRQVSNSGKGQTLVVVKPLKPEGQLCEHRPQATSVLPNETVNDVYAPGLRESFTQAIRKVQHRAGLAGSTRNLPYSQIQGTKASALLPGSDGLDVAATVSAAVTRLLADGMTRRLQISPADIRFIGRRPRKGSDICLLIDSSGSMAGSRLQTAKYLVGELGRYGCNRLSLVTFQDNRSDLIVPLTVSRQTVLSAFDTITPYGATPLALGIRRSLAYIMEHQPRKPLLVLITDGIPSRKYEETVNPLTDALAAAAEVKQANCAFLCIGLDADAGFLKELTNTADGVCYILSNG